MPTCLICRQASICDDHKLKYKSHIILTSYPTSSDGFNAKQARISQKQINSGTNDVRTELYGCLLWLKFFAIPFRSRAEPAERSKLRARGGLRYWI